MVQDPNRRSKHHRLSIDGSNNTHNTDAIHSELSSCNPTYSAALPHIVAPPRWMRTYEELRTTPRSSVVFAVDDESLAKTILQSRSLAIFGRHCSLRAYQDRPPVVQCKHCWGWNHKSDLCKNPPKCRLCSLPHIEAAHTEPECITCINMATNGDTPMTDGISCLHNLKCANCTSAGHENVSHAADSRRCPSRLEKYGTARSNERRPQTSTPTNPWKTAKPRKKTRLAAPGTSSNNLMDNFINYGISDFAPPPFHESSSLTSHAPLDSSTVNWTTLPPMDYGS